MQLLDVNVLIALAWPNHVHHAAARAWFVTKAQDAWATTPMTEAGFVRVSANHRAMPTSVTPAEALQMLDHIRERPGHSFLLDDVERVVGEAVPAERVVGHRQVTDAHLLAVAHRHQARLATFDRGMRELDVHGIVEVIDSN